MKKIAYILLLVLGMTLTSCMVVFDPGFDESPVIYLEAFPGRDADKVMFKIAPGYSRSNTSMMLPFDPEIIFEVNGSVIPVECIDVEEGYYVADYAPVPGDKLSVSVNSEGFTGIFARTSIPEPFPAGKIDYRQVQSGLDDYDEVLYVTFSGADPGTHYGIYFLKETVYETQSGPVPRIYTYAGSIYPETEFGIAPTNLEANLLYFNGVSYWAWDGKQLGRQSCTLSLKPGSSLYETSGEVNGYDDYGNLVSTVPFSSRTKINLMTMSDEFYKYQVAQSLAADYGGLMGFIAPSSYCYSNIDNGYGAFAGVTIVETDWITKEFIENNR